MDKKRKEVKKLSTSATTTQTSTATLAVTPTTKPFSTLSSSPLLNESNLIKYKIDTNLVEFNKNRPGISDEDVTDIHENEKNNNLVEFKDARFYTDYHFLKLANQLKEKTLFSKVNQTVKNEHLPSKPINIVEPLNVQNQQQACENISFNESTSPISSSLWKIQREQYEDRIRYLEEQIKGLYEQLEMQTQVNSELKKLLVASIGDDIQYKIERLINDKQRFEYELTNNSKRLAKMSEELEQISIQCDLWRTKFIASKSSNDELQAWKAFLLLLQQENNHLMRNLIAENEINNHKLNNIYKNLLYFKEASNPSNACDEKHVKYSVKNSVKLVCSLEKLVNDITGLKKQSINEEFNLSSLNDYEYNNMKATTKNEYLAKQLLIQFAWLPYSNCNSIDLIENLLNGLKLQKTKLIQRFDQFNDDYMNLTCCSKCKGNIKVV